MSDFMYKRGMSRRDFIKATAVLGAASGVPGLLQSCSASSTSHSQRTERRTLYFDNSHLDFANYHFSVVSRGTEYELSVATPEQILLAKAFNSFLDAIPDHHITHLLAGIELPADDIQLLYVKRTPKGPVFDPLWETASMFLHVPRSSLRNAFQNGSRNNAISLKARHYNLSLPTHSLSDVYQQEDLIDPTDSASAIVFAFPELLSFEPDSAAHVLMNIIDEQPATEVLAQIIRQQGSAWSDNVVLKDDDGNPMRDEEGNILSIIQYSATTMQFAGAAIKDSLSNVKQDPSLYVNLSHVTDDSQLEGKICTFQDGQTYTDMSDVAVDDLAGDVRMTLTDVTTGGGYKLSYKSGKPDGLDTLTRFTLTNGYTRHIGLYVRYLNANNKPIPRSMIGDAFFNRYSPRCFVLSGPNHEYDSVLRVIESNFVCFGIPVKDKVVDFDIPIPQMASSIQIIGNTLGHGDNYFTHIETGTVLTAVFDLAIPSLFLVASAATSYKLFAQQKNDAMIIEGIRLFISTFALIVQALAYGNPDKLLGLAVEIGKILLAATTRSKYLLPALLTALGVAQVTKVIPIIGAIISAVSSLASAAQITQTVTQVFNSPWTYVKTLSLSHAIRLAIHHDPRNPEGFPSVATHYVVTATCQLLDGGKVVDSATPVQITANMPATTRTAPIIAEIPNVPYGGSISFAVGLYSPTGWLAGYATLDFADNTMDDFSLTITQNEVPLTVDTYYSHKEKTALDAQGRHVWIPTKTPPEPTPVGQCNQLPGQLCRITQITDSNTFASLGYSWQAYGRAYQSCSATAGQMFFFANMSTAELPEDSHVISCGQQAPIMMAYDLMGNDRSQRNFYLDTDSGNIVRQIRLALRGRPDIDGPNSNRAWGRLNFSSDALLLHPNGKIVSINATLNKIEVLSLPQEATPDDQASLAAVYGGQGIREGLLDGPVCAALTPRGEVLILETANDRIQAFDTGGNPMKIFAGDTAYFARLRYSARDFQYIDMATEYSGYIYLVCYDRHQGAYRFYLDIYTPDGEFLSRTDGFSGIKIAVSYWRDVFAANMEALRMPDQSLPLYTEPSVSRWIPSTP